MKKISFVVPCYNSEAYMERCIDSLLINDEAIEIIIVNDGSTDQTKKIADRYVKKYPSIIKVIHKENGGHGSGVNAGLKEAKGDYFKVVDSDDWLDKECLKRLLEKIKTNREKPDLIVCNYIYDHFYEKKQKVMSFNNVFKENKFSTWDDLGFFRVSQYLIMHSLIYKTSVLKKCKLELPEHTFYVDNLVAYQPLPFVKKILYLNLDLYHYFIGREDQSVNEKVMITRVDQQIKVTKLILSSFNLDEVKKKSKKLCRYMLRMCSMMIVISSIYLIMIHDGEAMEKRKELWQFIKKIDLKLYRKLRFLNLAGLTYLPGKIGNFITLKGYKLSKKIFKFN